MDVQKHDTALAVVLKRLRERSGYRQVDIAEKLGVTYQQVQKYESGKSKLSYSRVRQYFDILNIDAASLERLVKAEMQGGL